VKIGGGATGPYIYAYEASRPSATNQSPGLGNGYHASAPAGEPLDQTVACSRPDVIPWYDVTPIEAEQSCAAAGGRMCFTREFSRACAVDDADGAGPNTPDIDNGCTWAYSPVGGACQSGGDYLGLTKVCNLGGFDFDPQPGNQDGVVPTASPLLQNCFADWSGYNGVASQAAYDLTGNLREVTRCQRDRALCGTDAAACATRCCSGTSTSASFPAGQRLCGALPDVRRLSGQSCQSNLAISGQCCASDTGSCNQSGACRPDVSGQLFCVGSGGPATSCRARGVACSSNAQCCNNEPCTGGVCGGAGSLPHTVYPAMGGSFVTVLESGASCDFQFYKVDEAFKLYDTGFRCCFDAAPN
jgi:hypothetical protein